MWFKASTSSFRMATVYNIQFPFELYFSSFASLWRGQGKLYPIFQANLPFLHVVLARTFYLTVDCSNDVSICRPSSTKKIFQRNPSYLTASLTSLRFSDCCQLYDRITSLRGGDPEIRLRATSSDDTDYKDCSLIPFSASPFIEQHLYYLRCD